MSSSATSCTLSLHDALPIWGTAAGAVLGGEPGRVGRRLHVRGDHRRGRRWPHAGGRLSAGGSRTVRARLCRRGCAGPVARGCSRSEEHTSELQSRRELVCRLLRRAARFPYTTLFRSGERPPVLFWVASLGGLVAVCTFVVTTGEVGGGLTPADAYLLVGVVLCGLGYAEGGALARSLGGARDRKSTRLNSSHVESSYVVFCDELHAFPTRRSSDLGNGRRCCSGWRAWAGWSPSARSW